MQSMTKSYNTKTAWAVAVCVVLVCVASFVYVLHVRGVSDRPWLDMHMHIFKELEVLYQEYRTAESAMEGYLLSGEKYYLDRFNAASTSGTNRISKLRESKDLDPGYAEKLREIQQHMFASFQDMTMATKVRQQRGVDAARSLLLNIRGNRRGEDVGSDILGMQEDEASLLRYKIIQYNYELNGVLGAPFLIIALLAGTFFFVVKSSQPALQESEEKIRLLKNDLDAAKAQIDRLANVDFLTEVLNIRGLTQSLQIEENRSNRVGGQLVAVLANIDNFRTVNNQVGHTVGDIMLKEIAQRMSGTLRPSDHIARVGGDEFLILLPDTQLAYAMRVADRIRTTVSESPLKSSGDSVKLTVSIGVASLPAREVSAEEAVALARQALKRSKSSGKDRVSVAREGQVFDEEPTESRDIVEVLCDGEHFRCVFQPIIDLSTDNVAGYEVFSRGPDGQFESPADFFRVCIEKKILTTVDVLCIKHCVATTADTKSNLRFHINVFPSTILETPIESLVALFPKDRGTRKYCIEISEQQFAGDPGYLRDHINALRHAGILVAIDDVGFGRSSLESLILLEPDIVKVDRKYVTGVARDPAKSRLLRRVVNVAKSLGAEVVAEGIEVRDDLPVLKEIGVNYGQGYYWGGLLEVLPEIAPPRTVLQKEKRWGVS